MTLEELKRYQYLQLMRRTYTLKLYNIKLKILNIRNAIALGINVATDPRYRDDYFALIGEYGEGIFILENGSGFLTIEELDIKK